MKRIGVVVQGPSDHIFWDRVLHKHHRGAKFSLRDMKSQTKLIAAAPALIEAFQDAGYDAIFLLLDGDEHACVANIRQQLDTATQEFLHCSRDARRVFLSVAFRELESWFLADPEALAQALGVEIPDNPALRTGGKSALKRFVEQELGLRLGYNERAFAEKISPWFDPARARKSSASFDYFWTCLEAVLTR